MRVSLEDRFWLKVQKTPTCWLWTGQIESNGYGRISEGGGGGRMLMVHRVAYELLVGPIPEGLEIDHVAEWGCSHRNCVNPAHLEPVTHQENCRRAKARLTHCKHGHEFTPENTRIRPAAKRTWRICLACQARYRREHAERKAVAA